MSSTTDVRDFLVSRRARLTPDQVGLAVYGANPRVPGLRREEVAMLAGVSADYYTELERGNLAGVSASLLEAICAALRLDEAECGYLLDLERAATRSPAVRRADRPGRRPAPAPTTTPSEDS